MTNISRAPLADDALSFDECEAAGVDGTLRTIDVVANPDPKRCQWCGERFTSTTAKAIHVHERHPDTIGRGRTRSVAWHCARCGSAVRPSSDTCSCGYVRGGAA